MYRLKLTLCLFLILSALVPIQAQTWELYDSDYQLKSRLAYESILLLSETVKIGKTDSSLHLLSSEFKPSVNLEGDDLYQFLEPWILVRNEKGIGAFHEYGQKVLDLEYDEIQTYFNLLLARKGNEYWAYERGKGKTTYLGEYEKATITHNGQLIAKQGENYSLPLSPNSDQSYFLLSENEGDYLLAKAASGYGLINIEGKTVLEPVIDTLIHTRGNFFFGHDEEQYLLIEGNPIKANVRYNSFHKITYEDGLMLEYIHGKLRRVMEEDGILLDAVGMTQVNRIENDVYQVRFRDDKLGLLGKKGWLVKPTDSLENIYNGQEGLFPAQKNGAYGFVDGEGNWKIPPTFQEVTPFSEAKAAFKAGLLWGLMNDQGSILSAPQWDEIKPFRQGLALAGKDKKWYLLDTSGKVIANEGYEQISRTEQGYFLFGNNQKIGLANTLGDIMLSVDYDFLQREKSDLIIVGQNQKIGIVTESGDVKLPLDYQEILVDLPNRQILAKSNYRPVIVIEPETKGKQKRKRSER
ncbi:WG containing repeat-containing protein [Algoriphagus faecimaris]|uniref:WG containing repeat-containing protein n=1 Tax=Algoriphagus faecimaris TaxID=686796 RepID=A0A1G6UNG7_9BACT|nr:WG repeat-containing protein [Algoriphagus faecimaris]SDD42286.1 WG containing repeat-containing protein [Algoriphagus faecimaris]